VGGHPLEVPRKRATRLVEVLEGHCKHVSAQLAVVLADYEERVIKSAK
jgi:hypothetical protein